MARQSRKISALGIYHVMLRGINKQNIFFCEDDFVRMMNILQEIPFERDQVTGKIMADNLCTIYAYCILDNHLHLLIREGMQNISEIMKRIEDRYAVYYNKKYERTGHLFQARFPSEPVNDSRYFFTLLRYIHRNPVKALESRTPEEYPYSSWNEYVNHPSNLFGVLKPSAIRATLEKFPIDILTEWVKTDSLSLQGNILPADIAPYIKDLTSKADQCLDMDSFLNVITDKDAMEILLEISGFTNPEDFRLLDAPTQIHYLLQAIDQGVKIKQAARLGTITEYQLRKAIQLKSSTTENCGESSRAGSVPERDKTVENAKLHFAIAQLECLLGEKDHVFTEEQYLHREQLQQQVRRIQGLGKKTYQNLHSIVEYLFEHPRSKCQEIAVHLGVSNETARRFLIRLSNANVVEISGKGKNSTYTLK